MGTDKTTIAQYNAGAAAYDAHTANPDDSPYHTYYEKPAIRAMLPELAGLKALSIGCGSGHDVQWLADHGADARGIDLSDGLIEIARRNYPDRAFDVMDMERLAFTDDSFDVLYSSLAIHYLDSWVQALSEAYRVLKPGGQYVFSCNHPIASAVEHVDATDGSKASLLGHRTDLASGVRTVYGDYLAADSDGTKRIATRIGDMAVTNYHKTFATMMDEIGRAGFKIIALNEIQPVPAMQTADPKHYEQLRRIPAFMVWKLLKGRS